MKINYCSKNKNHCIHFYQNVTEIFIKKSRILPSVLIIKNIKQRYLLCEEKYIIYLVAHALTIKHDLTCA